MKSFVTATFLGLSVLTCSTVCAGIFTSTEFFNESFIRNITYSSQLTSSALNFKDGGGSFVRVFSGLDSATVTTDTDSNSGSISELKFKQLTNSPSSFDRTFTVSQLVVDVPADFPDPGVTHIETTLYRSRIMITSVVLSSPTTTSTVAPLVPLYGTPPWFAMENDLIISSLPFVIQGTYEAIGPTTTKSLPFSVEYRPVLDQVTLRQRTGVKGGPGFNNGFDFTLSRGFGVVYQPVNKVVIDAQVDGMNFRLSFEDEVRLNFLRDSTIPEPGTFWLAATAALTFTRICRHRNQASAAIASPAPSDHN